MKKLWTTERIQKGFKEFITNNNRLPTAGEVDTSEHLPSSRYIQKRFGGLEALRKEFGYTDTHLGKGDFRSKIAAEAGKRSKVLTNDLQSQLYACYSEDCVQYEMAFNGKHRVNFYISTPEKNFGIDIFYAQSMRTLQSSVNIKMKKYINFTDSLYLVVANETLQQSKLDTYSANRKHPFPSNISLITTYTLKKVLTDKLHNT